MPLKFEKDVIYTCTQSNKKNGKNQDKKNFSKIKTFYMALMCFVIYCLSCITFEAKNHFPHGKPMTKSAAFNALFRRNYNLKIVILVTNILTGLITTLMITIADRYDIPYLYLPWLVNTMKGIALCEGPALLSLANVLLPNITLPTATFIFITFILYVEQLYIWNNVFIKFQNCWENYHNEKHCVIEKTKEKLFTTRNRKLMCQNNVNNELNTGVEKLKCDKKPIEFYDNINKQISTEIRLRPIKNATKDNDNFIQDQLLDITG
ncbi:hypothetical protein QLX08_005660 [Tetragonisca angustula]|uniref:Uncharacterized protein n=1 Tax=Tetragonisca angustula TaxID=166442 RepID=A0AAW0ZWZ2_9HYME